MCAVDWRILLEYLKVMTSWPVVVLIIASCFLRTFRPQIAVFLENLRRVTGPGGIQFDSAGTQSQESRTETPAIASKDPTVANEALLWEFRYLNRFFVLKTQIVLDALIQFGSVNKKEFLDQWAVSMASLTEKNVMLSVLGEHGLIILDAESISISDKGRQYHDWPERQAHVNMLMQTAAARVAAPVAPVGEPGPFARGLLSGLTPPSPPLKF